MKKIVLSFLVIALVGIINSNSFFAENNNEVSVLNSGKAYSKEEESLQNDKTARTMCKSPNGHDRFCYGITMGWRLDYAQFSNYTHQKKTHKTSSMMNGHYKKSKWCSKKKEADATTNYYKKYDTHNSYWNVK